AVNVKGYGQDGLATALKGADIVLIPAGVPRKPGMDRSDLFNMNAGIIKNLVEACADNCPKACIAIITNPVNTTVAIAAEVLKKKGVYDKSKLFGVTTLDVIRAETFVAELKGLNPENVHVPVIGGHSGTTILPLLSQVEGIKFSDDEVKQLTHRIQNAGTEVVEAKAGGGSATLSMGQAAARFCLSLAKAMQGEAVTEYAYVEGDGADAQFFAQAVRLGTNGVVEILPYGTLSEFEAKAKADMLAGLKGDIQTGIEFANQ
ncbi:MAG: malate dehydrogenase, partial [Idiomarina sp.]|nr:malate dehydrogenase [Idiomarina sp.]